MLAKIAPASHDFHAVARYLIHGKRGTQAHPNRVAWRMAHNLPTDDEELAATYMSATADRSRRTRNAAYHVMIAWHEREKPTPELMQTIAIETLAKAGLGDHQALIVGHGDTAHAHLHILLNRVHPETGRAWKPAHDFARFDRIMQELSEIHGCDYVPAHAFNPELTDDCPTKPDSAATYAAKRGADTSRLKMSNASSRKLGQSISSELDDDATIEDLDRAVEAQGLRVQTKGRGLVVGNPTSYATLSSLGLTRSSDNHIRLRQRERAHENGKPAFSVDAIDIVKFLYGWGLADREDIEDAIAAAAEQRRNRLAEATFARQLSAQLADVLKANTSLKPMRSNPTKTPRPNKPAARSRASR